MNAADRAMPGGPSLPSMRTILDADWYHDLILGSDTESRIARHEAVLVDHESKCDFCAAVGNFDGRLRGRSSWAYMCSVHFAEFGVGLGLGVGQELIVRP